MKRERGTGSKRLRGSVWWIRYSHNGKLVEESTHTSDEKAADKLLKAKVKAANTPLFIEPSARKVTFWDLIDLARREALRDGNRTAVRCYGTAENPPKEIRRLAEIFSGKAALQVTTDDIDKYTDARRAEGAQPATVNRELTLLRRGFKLALRKGLIPTAPYIPLRSEKGNVRKGFLEPADFDAFLDALRQRDPVVADLTEAAFFTLLRRGNIRNLAWTQLTLDVDGGHVVGGELRLSAMETKNKKPLGMPLMGRLLELIDRRWQARIATCPYVFHRKGVRLARFKAAWTGAAKDIGRPGLLMHDLRRSGARTLIRSGVPEDVTLKMGGWETRSMLTRYNVVDDADLLDAQEKLNAAFGGPVKVRPLRNVS